MLNCRFGSLPLITWQWGPFFSFLPVQVAMRFPLRDPCSLSHTQTQTHKTHNSFPTRIPQSCTEAQSGDYSGSGWGVWWGVHTEDRVFNECHYILMKPIGCAQNGHKPLWSTRRSQWGMTQLDQEGRRRVAARQRQHFRAALEATADDKSAQVRVGNGVVVYGASLEDLSEVALEGPFITVVSLNLRV